MQYQHSFPGATSPYNNYNNNTNTNFNNNNNVSIYHNPFMATQSYQFQSHANNFDPFAATNQTNNWNQQQNQNQQQQNNNNFFF